MANQPTRPLAASIILPCFNALEYSRQCVQSLARHTHPAWELIVIDNGSTDQTSFYFQSVADVATFPVTLIRNSENVGFPAACNQGLLKARADHIVLLNNDTVVTDGWLDQLLSLADSQASIGAVGPMSNYVSPPQLIPKPGYADMESMHAFAARWRVEHRGQWFTSPKLSGFCLLLKRDLLVEIGRLDESFGLGLFDDDDLCRRVVQAGYELAVAHDLFIHHYGSRTFIESGVDTARLLKENQALYASKWNIPPEGLGLAVTLRSWGEPQASLSRQARVSLVMIVRNEEDNLPLCLESVGGLFDEIVIVDTGSTDATREIALAHGATVFEFPWIDDFAAARNEALKHSTGDYAFWLDADDRIDPPDHEKLGRLFNGLSRENRSAYVVRCA